MGDVIPGARGVPLRTIPLPAPVHADAPEVGSSGNADVVLPEDFSERVRRIPPHTLVHIPVASRVKIASATAECWEGMAAGLEGWLDQAGGGTIKITFFLHTRRFARA